MTTATCSAARAAVEGMSIAAATAASSTALAAAQLVKPPASGDACCRLTSACAEKLAAKILGLHWASHIVLSVMTAGRSQRWVEPRICVSSNTPVVTLSTAVSKVLRHLLRSNTRSTLWSCTQQLRKTLKRSGRSIVAPHEPVSDSSKLQASTDATCALRISALISPRRFLTA